MTKTKLSAGCFFALLLAGCVSTTQTNLTPTMQPRNPNNQYLIEYMWNSNQQTVRPETIQPNVIVGFDTYPMKRVLKMTNRWETYVPVPPNQNSVRYHFKVDYDYSQFGKKAGKASLVSPEYKLNIVEK